jgi:hypothetical protein
LKKKAWKPLKLRKKLVLKMVGHAATKVVFVSMNAAVETKVKERDGLRALEKMEIGIVVILRCMNLHTAFITEDENILLRQN